MSDFDRRVRHLAALGRVGAVTERMDVLVVGAGPAGLAAAEQAAGDGARVVVVDWTPSPGRKFLMAGKSGLNLTQDPAAVDVDAFLAAYGASQSQLAPMLRAHPPARIVEWCAGLGQSTFVGSGRRVFPTAMKASPLLRAWLARLAALGVELRMRWRWTGWGEAGALTFETPDGPRRARPRAVVLAAGGASWPRLGADAGWVPAAMAAGAACAPFEASNVGYEVAWSPGFVARYAGAPVKAVAMRVGRAGPWRRGEWVVSGYGVEGSAIYALGPDLRAAISAAGMAELQIDLAPDRPAARLAADLARQPKKASLATRLRKAARLDGVKAALLRESAPDLAASAADPAALAAQIKGVRLRLERPRPIAEAISSAGGVAWSGLDEALMLRARPGVFCAGEMIDWDAPTGGYLLSACLATGWWAGAAAAAWATRAEAADSARAAV